MPVADRTYSFKAPNVLRERMREAGRGIRDLGEENGELLAKELALRLIAESRRLGQTEDNQSAFMRLVLEMVIASIEKLVDEKRYAAAYAELASERARDDEEFIEGAMRATAHLWRDGE